ncbi:MAG: hypothetical protein ACKOBG_09105 [Actinomycetota bacterium]
MTPSGPSAASDSGFAAAWAALDPGERRRLRRLVRMGRTPEEPALARLAAPYARSQMLRPWMRFFWLWFIPGLVIVLPIAARAHAIFVGVVIALAAQSVYAWVKLRKLARTG